MTGQLTKRQLIWLRGLQIADGMIPMSASELGDPEVSEIQSLGLVRILNTLENKHWRLTEAGEAALNQQSPKKDGQ